MCGEKPDILPLSAWTRGSPPRMRGKVQLQPGQPAALGITPAYAGKSKNLPALVCGNGDHPRVCGEKRKDFETANRKKGSPPRMRGKGCMFCCSPAKVGITPAYAGKSLLCMDFCPAYRDHPRVCGEKYYVTVGKADHEGSPPRMRGKVRAAPLGAGDAGITPAYAGKRVDLANTGKCPRDHPRVCGEKLKIPCWIAPKVGSPPRMRGKATSSCFWQLLRGDHPRVCGEKQAAHNT